VLLCTTPTHALARRLARGLLTKRLAACVSCLPSVDSLFWWQGRIDHARETLMVIKTSQRRLATAMRYLKQSHSYTVPELIAWPITDGDQAYLDWLHESCRG